MIIKTPTIAVLMSTYNGQKYIYEQIDSILHQKNVNIILYIRDDGSNDETAKILNEYQKKNKNIILVDQDSKQNMGVLKSYFRLMEYALKSDSKLQYFAFSDQDDVWLPEKLYNAVQMLEQASANSKGKLYYSNKIFVDQNLKTIQREHITYYGDIFEVLWQSLASGCTMVIDRTLMQIAASEMPQIDCIHDAWVYRTAKLIGSNIVFDQNAYIQYRQHGNNVYGMDSCRLPEYGVKTSKKFFQKVFSKREHIFLNFVKEIDRIHGDQIPSENKKWVQIIETYPTNIISKCRLIFNRQATKRGARIYTGWIVKVIFNGF